MSRKLYINAVVKIRVLADEGVSLDEIMENMVLAVEAPTDTNFEVEDISIDRYEVEDSK